MIQYLNNSTSNYKMATLKLFLSLTYFILFVLGNISIIKPAHHALFDLSLFDNNQALIPLAWSHSNTEPVKDDLIKFTFTVCSGPNNNIHPIGESLFVPAELLTDNQIFLPISNHIGTNGFYYVQIYIETKKGYIIHYSNRFQMVGMKGKKLAQLSDIDSISPPQEGALNIKHMHEVPYEKQFGLTMFAPAQKQPQTKITATQWTRRHSTSSVSYFTNLKVRPAQLMTLTPRQILATERAINYVQPAPMPWENGKEYDPVAKIRHHARKINL